MTAEQLAGAMELARSVIAVRALRLLHKPGADGMWCEECAFGWPCSTIRTLDVALQ